MIKLYVLFAIGEVFDRLMGSFGQDALDSLYWNTRFRPTHQRVITSAVVVLFYLLIHSFVLFCSCATLNVAMNSADQVSGSGHNTHQTQTLLRLFTHQHIIILQSLLTLLVSGNFAEIKSSVFKKFDRQVSE